MRSSTDDTSSASDDLHDVPPVWLTRSGLVLHLGPTIRPFGLVEIALQAGPDPLLLRCVPGLLACCPPLTRGVTALLAKGPYIRELGWKTRFCGNVAVCGSVWRGS